MTQRWMGWVVAALCALSAAVGCGDDAERSASQPAPPSQPSAAPMPPIAAEVPAAPAPAAPAQPSRALEFRAAGSPELLVAALGAPVPGVGRRLRNPGPQPLLLDFVGGARLTLEPQAELWVMELAPSLLSVAGRIQVQRLPEAARADQPSLRIATLGGALGVTGAASLQLHTAAAIVQTKPRARTQLSLLQGSVSWLHETALHDLAHERLVYAEHMPDVASLQLFAAKSAADADKRAPQLFRTAPAWGLADDPELRLEALLSELAALRDQGQGLLAPAILRRTRGGPVPDAGANVAGLPAAPRAYQKTLVQLAQRKLALKQRLLLAVEQSLLVHLLRCAERPAGTLECPALETWSQRFAEPLRAAL